MSADEQVKGSPARGRSALRSGALTGLSYVTLSLAAALAGAFLAHKFGRNLQTDGFMAAYGVYLVLVLGAQAFRMVVVPDLTRAEAEGRLGAEFRAYCLAFLVVAVPATVLTALFAGFFGELVTGRLPRGLGGDRGGRAALADPGRVPAAARRTRRECARRARQLPARGARLCARRASPGSCSSSSPRMRTGIVSLAWGLTLNGAVAVAVPVVVLLCRGEPCATSP